MILYGPCTRLLFMFAVLCVTVERATTSYHVPTDQRQRQQDSLADEEEDAAWREFQEFRQWKKSKENAAAAVIPSRIEELGEHQERFIEKRIDSDRDLDEKSVPAGSIEFLDPPPIDEPARMGRYIVNRADWTAVATISSRKDIATFPFTNVISFSDGPLGNGTGIPYMYLTPLDFTAQDIALDHRATLMMTLAQGEYCKKKAMDPMDPRCARIVLTGKIKEVKPGTAELEIAKKAVFGRHPWLANMPPDHHFFFAKLKIASIAVLDTFGGPKFVTVQDYLHPPTPKHRTSYIRQKRLQSRDFTYGNNNDYPTSKYVHRV